MTSPTIEIDVLFPPGTAWTAFGATPREAALAMAKLHCQMGDPPPDWMPTDIVAAVWTGLDEDRREAPPDPPNETDPAAVGGDGAAELDHDNACTANSNATDDAPSSGSQNASRIRVLTLSEALTRAPTTWLVAGILPSDAVGTFYGDSGSGKTFVALDLALSIAAGRPYHGADTKHQTVAYVAGEGGGGLTRRVLAYCQHHGLVPGGLNFLLIGHSVDLGGTTPGYDADALVDAILAEKPPEYPPIGLVVIDTRARNMGGLDENVARDAGVYVRQLDTIKERLGCCVIDVCHTGKDGDRGQRGSTAFLAAQDFTFRVSRTGQSVTIKTEKMKDDEPPEPRTFTLETVPLINQSNGQPDRDERGAQRTSLVLVPSAACTIGPAAGLGGNQRRLLELLPEHPAAISRASWFRLARDAGVYSSQAGFDKARGNLVDWQLVETDERGHYRRTPPA
jgi:hypothetical protein